MTGCMRGIVVCMHHWILVTFEMFRFILQKYPSVLVTGSTRDERVPYWLPLKWTAKLRAVLRDRPRTNSNAEYSSSQASATTPRGPADSPLVLCRMDFEGGHFGSGGLHGTFVEVRNLWVGSFGCVHVRRSVTSHALELRLRGHLWSSTYHAIHVKLKFGRIQTTNSSCFSTKRHYGRPTSMSTTLIGTPSSNRRSYVAPMIMNESKAKDCSWFFHVCTFIGSRGVCVLAQSDGAACSWDTRAIINCRKKRTKGTRMSNILKAVTIASEATAPGSSILYFEICICSIPCPARSFVVVVLKLFKCDFVCGIRRSTHNCWNIIIW